MKNIMTNSDLEKMIAEEILANNNLFGFDSNDIQKLKDYSDFIDGTVVNGKPDDLGKLADEALTQIKEAHPHSRLTMLMFKIKVAKGHYLTLEQLDAFNCIFRAPKYDIPMMYALETDAPIPDKVRLCLLCGLK